MWPCTTWQLRAGISWALERFYTRHFGFRRARVIPLGQDENIFIKSGVYLEMFQAKQESVTPPADKDGPVFPGWRHIAFQVDDIDAKLTDMGAEATVTLGPLDFGDSFPAGARCGCPTRRATSSRSPRVTSMIPRRHQPEESRRTPSGVEIPPIDETLPEGMGWFDRVRST